MAHKDHMSFIAHLCFAVGCLLLFSLATSGAAVAQNPVPLVNQPLVPDAVAPGGAGFVLTVNGSGFVSGSVVHWNGGALATTFVSGSTLKANVPASIVAKPGTASVTVVNPSPGGGTSNVVFFEVTSASSSIALSAPTDSSVGAGLNPAFGTVGDFNRDGKLDFRAGTTTNPKGPDLADVQEALVDENRVYYRFFTTDSRDIKYGTISQPGWRRLWTFSTNTRNDATRPMHIGDLTDPTNPWRLSNNFEFGNCDQEWDFNFYVSFDYNTAHGVKRAFCIEDTNRYHNDESTPLAAVYQSCDFQGISAGWGDEYQFGIDGQWIDVANIDTSQAVARLAI